MIDFCLNESAVLLEHDVDLVLQQIDMLLDTSPKEVLGEPNYGSDYEKFIWDLTANEGIIESYIEQNIKNNVDLQGFDLDVVVDIYMGQRNDIIMVLIELRKEGTVYQKIYNIGG